MWIAGVLSVIFILLSAIHWYWVIGGKFGLGAALPSQGGKRALNPGPILTATVALLLMVAAGLCLAQGELYGLRNSIYSRIGVGGLGLAFALRAVGEFRFVGLFKRVKDTPFAHKDTVLFTPLCAIISIMCWWIF